MNITTATRVLGLPGGRPDRDELIAAWRRFARAHHPDRCPGDPGAAWRFSTGREAFEVLIDRATTTRARPVVSYGRTGVLSGAAAGGAVPYAMPVLAGREWRA